MSLPRREVLKHLGLTGVGMALSACGGGSGDSEPTPTATPPFPTTTETPTNTPTPASTETPTSSPTPSASPTATFLPPPSCVLTPEQTSGPFFLDTGLLRRDITEGVPGAALRLILHIVDADDGCAPIRDAVVEAWHADADGVYSGFTQAQGNPRDASGETFLRGFQVSDENGMVEFLTIYPGWYPGRTVHIHIKVLLDATSLVTSQLYFPDSLTDEIHAQAPYDARGPRTTLNAADVIFRNGGESLIVDVDGGDAVSFVVGVSDQTS